MNNSTNPMLRHQYQQKSCFINFHLRNSNTTRKDVGNK